VEAVGLRPRQVRYQAALRPDITTAFILKHFQTRHPLKKNSRLRNLRQAQNFPSGIPLTPVFSMA
jgi:hypothetical protein